MILRPLGDRVLIKPEKPAEMTESGLHLVEHRKPDECGVVVAVGESVHPLRGQAYDLANRLALDGYDEDSIELVQALVRKEPSVKVGDTVIFSWASGQEVTLNDGEETYLLMKDSDLLAVVEDV